MTLATFLPFTERPSWNEETLAGGAGAPTAGTAGFAGDADKASPDALACTGIQWASRRFITSRTTDPRVFVDSRNLDTQTARSSVSLCCSHASRSAFSGAGSERPSAWLGRSTPSPRPAGPARTERYQHPLCSRSLREGRRQRPGLLPKRML